MAQKGENLPRPPVWLWPDCDRQFDERLGLLKKRREIHEALAPLLAAAAPQFIRDFAAYDDREMGLAGAAECLVRLAYAVVVGAGPNRTTYVKVAREGTHKSWKQITKLPERIERMVRDIRRVNSGPSFTRLGWAFRDLPTHMERYAAALRQKTTFLYSEPKQYLMETVKDWTGRNRDTEVAQLLNATAAVLQIGRSYEPLDLVQARSRHKKTRRT